MTDDDMREVYRLANEAEMHDENLRTGFGSNMSRGSILAGLRAVAAAAFDEGEANVYIGHYDQFDTGSRMTQAANPYT